VSEAKNLHLTVCSKYRYLLSKGENTVITMENSIYIDRPPQVVWDFFTNPANSPLWSSAESEQWTTDGPHGVGSTQSAVGKVLGRNYESTAEITAWDPPHEHGRKSTSGPFPWEAKIILEPKGAGTQLNYHITGEVSGFFKIAEGLVVKQLVKAMDTNFEVLKQLLETGQVEATRI
jgi:carbon monoxide dehydrogenase subunit G